MTIADSRPRLGCGPRAATALDAIPLEKLVRSLWLKAVKRAPRGPAEAGHSYAPRNERSR